MNSIAAFPVTLGLHPNGHLRARVEERQLFVSDADGVLVHLSFDRGCGAKLLLSEAPSKQDLSALLGAVEAWFLVHPQEPLLKLHGQDSHWLDALLSLGLARDLDNGSVHIERTSFWQYADIWLPASTLSGATPAATPGLAHPPRPRKPTSVLYQRYIPWLQKTIAFAPADPERDLLAFNRWMNNPRVAHFWEEQGDLAKHRSYLERQLADPHTLPVIGRFDGEPFGYFEIYWAKEDRIAPFYEAGDYDRGIHLLVGEEGFRGRDYYTAWFLSLCHYVFLDEARTPCIVCEPRHDNRQQLANFDRCGFERIKTFDFPHKRAVLVKLQRQRYFAEQRYLPTQAGLDASSRHDIPSGVPA